jgi:hypothetical protein
MAWHSAISRNLVWKLVSVVLACLVWMTLHSGAQNRLKPGSRQTFADRPISLVMLAGDERVFQVTPATVTVVLRGDLEQLKGMRPEEVEPHVSLTGIIEARELRKRVDVRVPPGVQVESVVPALVLVQVSPAGSGPR